MATSAPTDAPAAFHLLAKPTGAVCNLDCSYCFFLSKEMLYPGVAVPHGRGLLETYLRQLIEAHARVPEVTIAWQGGEPTLMGLDFFRRSVELAERYLAPGQQRRVHDPDERHAARRRVGDVLQGERLPGRALDRRPARDARRLSGQQGRQGHLRPGHARARASPGGGRGVERAHDRSTPPTPDRGREVYRFLRDECGARFMQFIPIIERVAEAARRRRACRGPRGATGPSTSRRGSGSRAAR